ncbi:hypothetical protein ACSPAB_06685 [Buttiauxella agrestis]
MNEKIYSLTEVFLKYSLWPVLGIVAICLFRNQIKAILSNIGGANSVKLNSAVLNFEATTTGTVQTQESEDIANPKDNAVMPVQRQFFNDENNKWFTSAYDFFSDGKYAEAQDVFDSFIKKNSDTLDYAKEHSFYLYLKYTFTLSSDILKNHLTYISQNGDIDKRQYYVDTYISCLQFIKQYEKAICFIEKEIEHTADLKTKAKLTIRLSKLHTETLDNSKAESLIVGLIKNLEENKDESNEIILHYAFLQLAEIEKIKKNIFNHVLCLDKAAEYAPSDTDTMFTAAYESSKVALSSLEVSNYTNVLSLNTKNSMAYNNIGVTAGNFDLKLTAGKYYNDAANLNNGLALANIGGRLLDAGLHVQAEEVLKKGLSLEEPHENIYYLATRINTEKENELNKWSEIQKQSKEKQRIIRQYTQLHYCSQGRIPTHQNWVDNKGVKVNLQHIENSLTLNWESTTNNIELISSTENLSFNGIYTSKKIKTQNSLLSFGESDLTFHCLAFYDVKSEHIYITSPQANNEFTRILSKA